MNTNLNTYIFLALILAFNLGCQSLGQSNSTKAQIDSGRLLKPYLTPKDFRGGTTSGAKIDYDQNSGQKSFEAILQAKDKKTKDRKAILAQVGEYKVSFEFAETFAFEKDQKLDKPYFSWATEYVFPIKETENFISLQHILVMTMKDKNGKNKEPHVVKHWRQDWSYEPGQMLSFIGFNTWKNHKISKSDSKGSWVQHVYQVDDSPRYSALGRWVHTEQFSTWQAKPSWRPLPRREYTQRSDYDVMESTNRVTVTPTGWYHEQDNLKVVLDEKTMKPVKFLTRELGFNRYERIKNYDFQVGRDYWEKTKSYWQNVRNTWDQKISQKDSFKLAKKVEDKLLYKHHFEFAQNIIDDKDTSSQGQPEYKAHAEKTINSFLIH